MYILKDCGEAKDLVYDMLMYRCKRPCKCENAGFPMLLNRSIDPMQAEMLLRRYANHQKLQSRIV